MVTCFWTQKNYSPAVQYFVQVDKALLEICAISVDSYNISEVLDTGHTNGDIAIFTLRNGFSFLHRMSALLYPSGANMLKISPV